MKQPIHPYAVYDSKEAAELLSVDPITIQRYIRAGKLVATKFGKVYRISGQSLLDLMSFDQESVTTVQDRVKQVENSNFIKSKSYLLSDARGEKYLNLINLTSDLLLSSVNPDHINLDENEKTIRYIASRAFNTAMAAFREALSGYHQVSVANQRDLIEIQFLTDYFRSYPEKIREWREADNKARLEQFSPGVIRDALDKRDGFQDKKRATRYKQFCEMATHVTYPGIKLMANQDNLVEIGPFYDEFKLLNIIHELAMNYGYAVVSVSANLKIYDPNTAVLAMRHMEEFGKIFNVTLVNSEKFKSRVENIEKLVQQVYDMRKQS